MKSSIKKTIGFIGLGYAGFPMAYRFSKQYQVIGFDRSSFRISELNSGRDHTLGVSPEQIKEMLESGSVFTDDINQLCECDFYIITVPTPVDKAHKPDFSCIVSATRTVAQVLKVGDVVVYESTVYPGATEEICVPLLEEVSGLKFNKDFFVGYSPERINPGDKENTPDNIIKVVSGSTPEALSVVSEVYESVVGKGHIHSVSSIKVAEACKVLENTQRDVNIALMNEVAQMFDAIGIDTNEVVDAMNTKWNALGFRPGLVGGHCISVDPYYMIDKAETLGVDTTLMSAARRINNSMPKFISCNTINWLIQNIDKPVSESRILILGFTYKANCPDIRDTRVYNIYKELTRLLPGVVVFDPVANPKLVKDVYGVEIVSDLAEIQDDKFDVILLCVAHDEFRNFDFKGHLANGGCVYDIMGNVSQIDNLQIKKL